MINEYLNYISEGITELDNGQTGILYHGSPTQNLKVIDPNKSDRTRLPEDREYGKIYGSWIIEFAAMFCSWKSFRGSNANNQWTIYLEDKKGLDKPCSIYHIKGKWFKVKNEIKRFGPEMYATSKCRVIKEIKYKSVYDCFKQNNIKIVIR